MTSTPHTQSDYSMILGSPLPHTAAHRRNSLWTASATSASEAVVLLRKTLSFLCFQMFQHADVQRVSKPLRSLLLMRFLEAIHQSPSVWSLVGVSSVSMPSLLKLRNYTCLSYTHCTRRCSTVSSSCSHRKQGELCSCNPCLCLWSDVQILC